MSDDTLAFALRRCPRCDVLVDNPNGLEVIACRNGHTFEREEAFCPVSCEGCSDLSCFLRSIPGVRFPATPNEDDSREWIERCDECEEFEEDADAADALVRAGRITGWRWAKPHGMNAEYAYAVSDETAGSRE